MKVMLIEQIAKVCYKYTFSLGNALMDCGNDVTLAIDQKTEKENCKCTRWNLFNTDENDVSKFNKLRNYIVSYEKIYKEMKKNNYDVLHTQWLIISPLDYFFINKIKRDCDVKLVVTVHDILPFNQKIYDFYFHKKVYKIADSIILQTENNRNRFKKLFPENYDKCTVIPHGHFLDYAESATKEESREYLHLPKDKFIFLFFGQIKKVKGIGILLKAYAEFCKECGDTLLVIAGKIWKDDFSQYQAIIDEEKLKNNVITDIKFIPDDEVKYYYLASDCCVLPYLDVYQSGVIQLCYAYKKPVIASNIDSFKEIVKDSQTGFLCEVNDICSLKESMKRAVLNSDNLPEMGLKGYTYIKNRYSWKDISEKINKIYLE